MDKGVMKLVEQLIEKMCDWTWIYKIGKKERIVCLGNLTDVEDG